MTNLVRIVIGSASDEERMKDTIEYLNLFCIPFDFYISSAHRKPDQTALLAKNAERDGIQVIIAAAGMAAHLPGVIASHTTLPVIGIPLQGESFNGLDSLLSIVQMPTGVPVATVAVNGCKNAAILAAQIIALTNQQVKDKLVAFKANLAK